MKSERTDFIRELVKFEHDRKMLEELLRQLTLAELLTLKNVDVDLIQTHIFFRNCDWM